MVRFLITLAVICSFSGVASAADICSASSATSAIINQAQGLSGQCGEDFLSSCHGDSGEVPNCPLIDLRNCTAGRAVENEPYFNILQSYRMCQAAAVASFARANRIIRHVSKNPTQQTVDSMFEALEERFGKCESNLVDAAEDWVTENCK